MRRSHLVLLIITLILLVIIALITTAGTPSDLQRYAAVILLVLGGLGAIAEVTGWLGKLGIPELVFPNEPRFITEEKDPFLMTVALWGSTGSGKTWIIRALARTLHTKYRNEINGLKYSLEEVGGINTKRLHGATPALHISAFRFERRHTKPKWAQLMSSFSFKINVYDSPGRNTTDLNMGKARLDNATLISMASADVILIVLDLLTDRNAYGLYSSEYPQLVKRLFDVLEESHPGKERLYAVCVTKADQIPGGIFEPPNILIKMYFDTEMTSAMTSVLHRPKPGTVDTFTTSSVGLLDSEGNANYDPGVEYLRDSDRWRPYGVEFPFFWAFEKCERQFLENEMRQTLLGRLTMKLRLSQYIPYPTADYEDYFGTVYK